MGVKNLWDILESCKKILPLHHLQNKRVCIDLSCWIVQLQNVNKSYCSMKDKLYLKGLFHRLRALIALNCSIIFVTDGSIPSIKLSAYRRRLNARNEGPLQEIDSNKPSSVRRNMGSLFSCTIKEAKLLANALGIPCLDGVEEAEAQCAVLNSESLCDACFTSDSDAFLFGARTVYRDICLADGGYVVCYEMTDIEKNLGFGRNSLIALAVLLGGDYSNGVHGIGPESACNLVKSVGDSVVLQQLVSEGMSFVKKPKASKRKGENMALSHNNGIVSNIQSDAQFLQVIDAYLKPKFHSPDSDAVNRVLGTYSFNRIQLQEECTKFFDWSPEKTDEYILPKIAERNLRRYAYLRHTSSKVGLKLPIYEIPVKCPISSIIKPRTLKGRDYFEVSWNGFHGLKTSAVPADLIQSACPEKIAEFDERRAQVKKTKQCRARPKKIVNKTPMAEAEQTTFVIACEGSRVEKADDDAENPCSQELLLHDVATLDDSTNQEQQFQNRGQSKYSDCNLMRSRLVKKTSVLTLLDNSTDQEQLFLDSGQCKFLDCNLMGSSRLVKKADVVTVVDDSTDQKQLFQDSGQSKFMDCDLMGSRLVKKTDAVTLVDNDSKDKEQVLVDKSHRRHGETNHVLDCHFTAEVIDLVSPSPARRVSKSQEDNFQYMEIIDSENECSPEHLRRRRELDSFLDKVKKDDKQHSHNNSCINNFSL